MIAFLFRRNHFILDLLVSLLWGAYLGYFLRNESDSGVEYHPDLYVKAAIVGAISSLIAWLISFLIRAKTCRLRTLLLYVFLQPLFFGLGYRGMMFVEWMNWNPWTVTNLWNELKLAFGLAVVYSIPFVFLVFLSRSLAYFMKCLWMAINPRLR